jgi:MFS family permease
MWRRGLCRGVRRVTRVTPALADQPGFTRFWVAATVSDFGTYVTTLGLQLLIVVTLHGTAADVGWVSAARWLPYVLLGLVAGMLVDRWDRRRTLIGTDLVRGGLLFGVGGLGAAGLLSLPMLMLLIGTFGLLSLFNDVAYQSFVPHLVPRTLLTQANARLEQSDAVAQTTGPALAGAIIGWIGAPFAFFVDAASHVAAGTVIAGIPRVPAEPAAAPAKDTRPDWRAQVAEGLRWVYRHPLLGPLAVTDHGWFLFSAVMGTVFVVYAVDDLGFTPLVLGVTLACAGVGSVAGSLLSVRAGERFGYGPVMAVARASYAPACVAFALAPAADAGGYRWISVMVVAAGQVVYGLSLGFEGPLEMGFRQTVTPNRLQGRMNAAMRSTNRAMIVIGAPLGGLLVALVGYRATIWVSAAGFTTVAVVFGLSRMGHARQPVPALD